MWIWGRIFTNIHHLLLRCIMKYPPSGSWNELHPQTCLGRYWIITGCNGDCLGNTYPEEKHRTSQVQFHSLHSKCWELWTKSSWTLQFMMWEMMWISRLSHGRTVANPRFNYHCGWWCQLRRILISDHRRFLIWVCLKIVYPYTQWLMIIIPTKWL